MNQDFFKMKKEEELLEKELYSLKETYQKRQMSEEQLKKLKLRMEEADMANKKEKGRRKWVSGAAAAAACIGAFMILPNTSAGVAHAMEQIPVIGRLVEVVIFRDYEYDTDRHRADIEVPEIKIDGQAKDGEAQENLERTTGEINEEIRKITDQLIEEFETYMTDEEGYQDITVTSEVLSETQDYFTLKLLCYQGAGSGYQWNYYYTIDLNTGERMKLKDIFKAGADYMTPISENIKEQMKEQMEEDDNVYYWLDDEVEDWNFKSITEDTSFYLNEAGNVVICFNEGDVAPMYMGAVEFEIPADVLKDIRKFD